MIKLEKTQVVGWEPAIRGMRNPKNSWDKSDSHSCGTRGDCNNCIDYDNCPYGYDYLKTVIGPNDHDLMMRLAKGGPVHAKYRRMIVVYVDITAPLYWWKEFDTYKVGTVANSCSTMHKLTEKEFTLDDFSHEHLIGIWKADLKVTILKLNIARATYIYGGDVLDDDGNVFTVEPKNKDVWEQMIQSLPSSYNQKRTVMMNYEVLAGLYPMRKNHKLKEWHDFCDWIEGLPYSEFITTPVKHNPLAHPETYVEDSKAMINDMTDAQRAEVYAYLTKKMEDKTMHKRV